MIWYAVTVPRGKEFLAEQILRDRHFATRVPVIHALRRPHRRAKSRELHAVPHFPGWVFVGFDATDDRDWEALRRVKIVTGIFAPHGIPLQFPEATIIRIMHDFDQRPVKYAREIRKKYRVGLLADIVSGPYQGGVDEHGNPAPPRRVRVVPVSGGMPTLVEVYTRGKAA